MGFEPTTPCGAPDFESGRWPVRLPSQILFKIYRPPVGLTTGFLDVRECPSRVRQGIFQTADWKIDKALPVVARAKKADGDGQGFFACALSTKAKKRDFIERFCLAHKGDIEPNLAI